MVIEPFGRDTFKIESLPPFLDAGDPLVLVQQLIDQLREVSGSRAQGQRRIDEELVVQMVCRQAVRSDEGNGPEQTRQLLENLLSCEMPYCCPVGRPTMIQMSYGELDRKFGRAPQASG